MNYTTAVDSGKPMQATVVTPFWKRSRADHDDYIKPVDMTSIAGVDVCNTDRWSC